MNTSLSISTYLVMLESLHLKRYLSVEKWYEIICSLLDSLGIYYACTVEEYVPCKVAGESI